MSDDLTRKCTVCGRTKPLRMYYKHPKGKDGYFSKCKSCHKTAVKKNYRDNIEKYREYERIRFQRPERKAQMAKYQRQRRERNRGKYRARQAVSNAIRDGHLVRLPCEVCGDPKSQAHHEDYRKPLDVKWLCFKHHREAHGQRPADEPDAQHTQEARIAAKDGGPRHADAVGTGVRDMERETPRSGCDRCDGEEDGIGCARTTTKGVLQ